MKKDFESMETLIKNAIKDYSVIMSGVECTYDSANSPSITPTSIRNIEVSMEELVYSTSKGQSHSIKLPRYYLYFADASCFSFRLSDMYSMDLGSYSFIFFVIILYCELNSAILVDDETMLRSLNDLFKIIGITTTSLKPYLIEAIESHGAKKTIKTISKYSFFSFESIVKMLQEDELYDILAEVLDAGNELGLIGSEGGGELL